MKLLLLKILLQRRARDEGFTLPMVIALGLVMLLLGAINLVRSSEENLSAISQNSRTDALAIAELGIVRYRQLLDTNRALTLTDLYDDTVSPVLNLWTAQTETCDVITDTGGGWADYISSTWRPINLDETTLGRDVNNDGDSSDTAANIGDYKIVNYIYNSDTPFDQTDDANNVNSDGTLIIKGRTPDGSKAQIETKIPIRINPQDMDNLAPALWIEDNTITDAKLGTLTVTDGKIVIKDQATTTRGCNTFTFTGTNNVISDPRNVPPITNIKTLIDAATLVPPTPPETTGATKNNLNNALSSDMLLGRTTDNQHSDERFYYEVTGGSLNIDDNVNLETDGTAKVTLYVDNDITIGNSVKINKDSISSTYLEIYVNGNRTININTGGTTVDITAFIHAPDSTLNITGGGTVNIKGSVWVQDWNNSGGATVTITPDNAYNGLSATSDKSYEFYTTTQNRTPKPLTDNPIDWKTEEVRETLP